MPCTARAFVCLILCCYPLTFLLLPHPTPPPVAPQLLGLSLLFFQGKAARQLIRTASASLQISTAQSWLGLLMPIVLMYTPVHVFFTLWTLSYTFLPVKWAVSLWVAFLVPYYGFTVVGHPHHTGGAMGLGYTLNKLVST